MFKHTHTNTHLQRELLGVPGLRQQASPLEHVPHPIPREERRTRKEVIDLCLI